MSTSATIKIEGGKNFALYKHFDGYPEATLKWLEKFNKEFTENRGNDISYKKAQLVRSSIKDAEEFNLDASEYTGWGIFDDSDECYVEFEYTLMADGSVKTIAVD